MIISRTPFRVSFLGGGTDLEWFYSQHGGAVISTSIDKYMFLSAHPTFDPREMIIKYSKIEHVGSADQIEHPVVRSLFTKLGITGLDLSSSPDIPAGTGLASSSAYTVGLLTLIHSYFGKYMSKQEIAEQACEIEIKDLGGNIGKQDQYACALGGVNFLNFNRDGTVDHQPILLSQASRDWLNKAMIIVRVGGIRSASQTLASHVGTAEPSSQIQDSLLELKGLAESAVTLIPSNPQILGSLVNQAWGLKKLTGKDVSNIEVDEVIALGLKNGALGAKLLGAGQSGFVLFIAEPEAIARLEGIFAPRRVLRISTENSGSRIIYDH